MDHGTMALMIPILALSIPIVAIWTTHQRQMAKLNAGRASEAATRAALRMEKLEERVRVLERIVTDRGTSLANEIEALRQIDHADTTGKLQ